MSTSFLAIAAGLALLVLMAGFALGWRAGRARRDADRESPATSNPNARGRGPVSEDASPVTTGADTAAANANAPRDPPALSAAGQLARAESWGYQLQDLNVERAAASPFDMLVIDFAYDGDVETALKPSEVARLQRKPDGSRRLVLAYVSVGEAESYRSYWRKEWKRRPPGWLLGENPDWEENYAVCFWDPDWQALLWGNPGAYVDFVMAQGFDGVYLDKCDVCDDLKRHERKAAALRADLDADMVALVSALAEYARKKRPEFLVVMQNAEHLLEHPALVEILDGAAKEELLYGLDAVEKANPGEDITWSREALDAMRRAGKPVFVVEYLNNREKIARAAEMILPWNYVLYISDKNRELDRLKLPLLEA